MTRQSRLTIRPATADDVPRLLAFSQVMAEYEHLADQVTATEEALLASLFGDPPASEALLAFEDDNPAGFAVYFHTYSTFLARRSMYLEDVYVSLNTDAVAWARCYYDAWRPSPWTATAVASNGWLLTGTRTPTASMRVGAEMLPEWRVFRVHDDALSQLAEVEDSESY